MVSISLTTGDSGRLQVRSPNRAVRIVRLGLWKWSRKNDDNNSEVDYGDDENKVEYGDDDDEINYGDN